MNDKTWRNEIKYVCSDKEMLRIEHAIRNICRQDSHGDENGEYRVRSLYFDDYWDTCYWENENGIAPRKKYRIRIYNENTDRIFLECKHKKQNMTQKDTCEITKEECENLMQGKFRVMGGNGQESLLNYFYVEMVLRTFTPKVIVQYERTAYVYHIGNVRITFDRNIAMSDKNIDFLKQCVPMRPVMPTNYHILEVKYDEFIPDFIYNALQVLDLHQTNFSKYYISRKMQYAGR